MLVLEYQVLLMEKPLLARCLLSRAAFHSRTIRKVSWLWVPDTSGKRCEWCEYFQREETGDRRC